ncbi:MAG: ROK family protein [Thermoguttaceae bacterium]|nr:ROK family protein [Thermoguttaceae bacterium]MDW8078775.1 ROK family protein [Thermoguttaceae bacterium]
MAKKASDARALFVGVDIGGTKIQATLATGLGEIRESKRVATPREGGSEPILTAIKQAVEEVVRSAGVTLRDIAAIGVGVPGVTDFNRGEVVVTPNMGLGRFALGPYLENYFKVPVVVENDCNLGTFGECWLGAGQGAESVFGIFVGTGIGGGFVRKRKIWRGARKAAGEVGHIVMELNGPLCGCGNRGCLEALASRSAVERQIREAISQGRSSVLAEAVNQGAEVIRSKMLRNAVQEGDGLVAEVLTKAAEYIGAACLTVRHLFDPEVIVLGGGLMEACHEFMMPIIERIWASDRLPGASGTSRVALSTLEDDAVVLGAVALAAQKAGFKPFRSVGCHRPVYAAIEVPAFGVVRVGNKTYARDVYILADGRVCKRKKKLLRRFGVSSHLVCVEELRFACDPKPEVLFIGIGHSGQVVLGPGCEDYLRGEGITYHLIPTSQLAEAYNNCAARKAAIVHVTC